MTTPQATPKKEFEMSRELSQGPIMELGLGFWGSKVLLSAIELGVFTELAQGPCEGSRLAEKLGLHSRSAVDFLDALVALGMLKREHGLYENTEETGWFLDRGKPSYIGGILEYANNRNFHQWAKLTHSLRSGNPQRDSDDVFEDLYRDQAKLKEFLSAMTGGSKGDCQKIPMEGLQNFRRCGHGPGRPGGSGGACQSASERNRL